MQDKRTHQIHIVQTPQERAELEALAESLGMTMSTVVRYAVKRLQAAEQADR